MEIGLKYSSKDPNQKEARDSLLKYISTHGLLVDYKESDQSINSPIFVVDGVSLQERRKIKRNKISNYPNSDDMLQFLEKQIWSL